MDNTLQDIKDRLNIADVISSYIQIKKAGVNFKANCPFHHEKTASLVISPQKQIWHCFGCGEGGDVFGFVMRHENVDFKDALKLLADKAGVKLPQYKPQNPQEQSEKELLMRINDFAARFYNQVLTKDSRGKQALEYLKKRGLTKQTIDKWQIGFAPDDFHALEQALTQKKVKLEDMVKAGVSSKNERGQIYDRFRERITFPIFNYFGETIGFSARILNDDGKSAKYINTPETPIYNKSKILFGLNFAKQAIRKKDEVIIVEGQMDCISLHQAGFDNVVASSGTAFTEGQLKDEKNINPGIDQNLTQVFRLTKNLKFCFDGDGAGQLACRRAGEMSLRQGFRLKVISLEQAKDPDELVKRSPGLWEKAVSEARWFLDWQMDYVEKRYTNDLVDQKHYLNEVIIPLLSHVSDPLEQDHYIRRMAEKFGIAERVIREQIKRSSSGLAPMKEYAVLAPKANALEKELLGGALVYLEFAAKILPQTVPDEFSDADIRRLIGLLKEGQTAVVNTETVAKEAVFMVESQKDEMEGGAEQQLRQLQKSLALFKVNALKKQQQELNEKIRLAQNAGNKDLLQELTKQFVESSNKRLEFEKLI